VKTKDKELQKSPSVYHQEGKLREKRGAVYQRKINLNYQEEGEGGDT